MPTRTVAHLTPLYFDERSCLGGGERYPLNLARGVVEASTGAYRARLISFGESALRRPLAPGVELIVLPFVPGVSQRLDVVSWELPEALDGVDLLHVHQAYNRCTELALVIGRQRGLPICVTDHGGHPSELGIEVGSLDLADRIIIQSEFAATIFQPTRTPIVLLKGGVDADHFRPPASPVTRDRVLYVGRLLPHKGIDQLIAALPPDLPLTICGQPYNMNYVRLLHWMAQGKQVEFVDNADDSALRDLYHRAWATVLPSTHRDIYGAPYPHPELMGFTLLESMACGTPAICTRVAAMPEFIRDGETGFVVDDGAQLTERLVRLASDPNLVEQMGCAARSEVECKYDRTVVGARLKAIYDGLIEARNQAAA